MRRLLRLPIHTVRAAVFSVLLIGAVFLLLTRTEVGRDQLRLQTERAFGDALQGELRIGRLSGNLVGTVYALDVEIRDPAGRLVLRADSVVVRPTWRALLMRRVEVAEATLIRPQLTLVFEDGRWNLADPFRSRSPANPDADPLGLRLADVLIVDATVRTSRVGDAPDAVTRGAVFDYTDALLTGLSAEITLDLVSDQPSLQIGRLRAALHAQAFAVQRLDADLAFGDGLRVSDVVLETDATRLTGAGSWGTAAEPEDRPLALQLDAQALDFDEWRRLFPLLPLHEQAAVRAHLAGRLGALDIAHLDVAHARSRVSVSGQVTGLPGQAELDLTVSPSRADPLDLAAIWPEMPLPWGVSDLGVLDVSGSLQGRIPVSTPAPLRLDARFALGGGAGRASGTLGLTRAPGKQIGVRLDAVATRLDPGALLDIGALDGEATGRVQVATPGARPARDSSRVAVPPDGLALRLDLTDVRIPGRSADALAADVVFADGGVQGTAALRQGGSRIAANGRFGFRDGVSAEGTARLSAFDLAALAPSAPRTELNGRLTIDAAGPQFRSWTGSADLALSSAAVVLREAGGLETVEVKRLSVQVAPPGRSPRLRVSSDAADATVESPLALDDFVPLLAAWSADLAAAGTRIWDRSAALDSASIVVPGPAQAIAFRPLDPFSVEIALKQPAAVAALVPGFPDLGSATLAASGRIGSDAVDMRLDATAERGAVGSLVADGLHAVGTLTAQRGSDLLETTGLDLSLSAGRVRLWPGRTDPPRVEDPLVRLRYADRHADLHFSTSARTSPSATSAASSTVAPDTLSSDTPLSEPIGLRLAAGLDVLPDRNRVRLDTLWADAAALRLALVEPGIADLVDGTVVLDRLAFERLGVPGPTQRLAFAGTLSPASTDSLIVEAEALELGEVLQALNVPTPLGGRLHGRTAIAGVLAEPQIGGRVVLEPLLFDGRPAGFAVLESDILGGEAGLGVHLRISPLPPALLARPGAAENDLAITGEMRLPSRRADGSRDPGRLNLAIDADRLDLFFFDWLFPSIVARSEGAARGTGRIQGTFSYPVFLAGLDVAEGAFDVPSFGLRLGVEGRIEVDGDGIHVRQADLSDPDGGRGQIAGSILFNRYRYFSLDLAGRLSQMQVIDVPASDDLPFYGDIRASGDLSLTGPLDNAFLRSENATTTPDSRIFIPVTASGPARDEAFLVFADSLGQRPEREQRRNLVSSRPKGERAFLDGLDMLLNISAPPGSGVHLIFDPASGEEIVAQGSARIQLGITDGQFTTYGRFDVDEGAYAFTAGDVFTRTFTLEPAGSLVWTGDPIDARMSLAATYRTRAALAGLGLPEAQERQRVPVVVRADVGGRVTAPLIQLSLAVDRQGEGGTAGGAAAEALRTRLNESDRKAEYATSVLLTNSFLLAPSDDFGSVSAVADELLYTSLGALVSSRVGSFVNRALGNDQVEVLLGVQPGTDAEALDVTYGVALRFLDERLVLRGEGLYQRDASGESVDALQGEVAAELRLSDEVSIELFARREGDPLVGEGVAADPYGTVGAGVTYRSEFTSWRRFFQRLFGGRDEQAEAESVDAPFVLPAGTN